MEQGLSNEQVELLLACLSDEEIEKFASRFYELSEFTKDQKLEPITFAFQKEAQNRRELARKKQNQELNTNDQSENNLECYKR